MKFPNLFRNVISAVAFQQMKTLLIEEDELKVAAHEITFLTVFKTRLKII